MLTAVDVHYDDVAQVGFGAAICFERWEADWCAAEYRVKCDAIAPYVPGSFYKRELPCILAVLAVVEEPADLIIIDSYVNLGSEPGLGMHLWEALDRRVPIVGVAKSRYYNAVAAETFRGRSKAPLFVTAVGIEVEVARECLCRMAGPFRVPSLLKRVDQLSRK
jgi:deoxyribonuclease V